MLCLILACLLADTNQSTPETNLLRYFTQNLTPNGLVQDRESNKEIVSVAATGFGMQVLAIASQENTIQKSEALARVKNMFRTTIRQNPKKNRGWLYHFSTFDGTPVFNKEVSTIDTAIFYLGARRAAELLEDEGFLWEVEGEISRVDTEWLMRGPYILHGFTWKGQNESESEFIDVAWDNYSEGIIIYRLFNIPYNPRETKYDLPLFVYYYPLCFFDEPLMVENLKKAIAYQQERYTQWGFSASDTENRGYQAFDKDTISPLTILTITSYLKLKEDNIKNDNGNSISFPADDPEKVCVQSRSRLTKWESSDRIGVDTGCAYILLYKSKTLEIKK